MRREESRLYSVGELQIRPNGAWMGSPERGFSVAYGEIFFKSMQIIQIFFLFLYLCCDMRITMTV